VKAREEKCGRGSEQARAPPPNAAGGQVKHTDCTFSYSFLFTSYIHRTNATFNLKRALVKKNSVKKKSGRKKKNEKENER
jgi:hypothetical protein